MKIFKRMKGKFVAGSIIAAVLVFGGGFALAGTDAGQVLKDWFERAFSQSVEEAEAEARDYGESLIPELEEEYDNRKAHEDGILDRQTDREISKSKAAIEETKLTHLESLGEAKEELLEEIDFRFYNAFVDGVAEINRLGDEASIFVNNDLRDHFGNKEEEALTHITDELTTAKDNAVSELEEAIDAAKGELEAELDAGSENLVYNLTTQIDHKVDELRREVSSIIANYGEQIEGAIVAHAAELEQEAFEAMEDVVLEINN